MDSPVDDSDSQRVGSQGPRLADPPSTRSGTPARGKKRTRSNIACDMCRARRTRCDNKRPSCSFCCSRSLICRYQEDPEAKASRTDLELASINKRLDHLTTLLTSSSHTALAPTDPAGTSTANGHLDLRDSPYKLLGTASLTRVLGLGPDFAEELLRLERSAAPACQGPYPRLLIVQQQHAISALAAFSEQVHVWYPILRPGFSEQFFRIIQGPLSPSPDSCLVLLVAAIGCLALSSTSDSELHERPDTPYFEAALAALPIVIEDSSVTSLQCLVLLSIYYCCLMKPCQAHDYSLIVSFKVQNLLKRPAINDPEALEHVRRAFWAVLLIESELNVQFDVVQSGIWNLDEHTALPDSRRTWQYSAEAGSPMTLSASPASVRLTPGFSTDKVQSYFLAEIAMRRMLHRCNTAIKRDPTGKWIYAPKIAVELERQLENWYGFLPGSLRFDTHLDHVLPETLTECPLTNFLRVQYYCCKISVYWPAVYQVVQDGQATDQLLDHCQRFFHSYTQLMPSILVAFETCLVNRWTLFASIFMVSVATMKAIKTPCLAEICPPECYQSLSSATQVSLDIVRRSPSLSMMYDILYERVSHNYETPG